MSALLPSVVAGIDDLELAARLVVEGLRAGPHRSPLHGYSAEFQQHRPYRAGDDLKYLDWKLLARTDRLYSKQFRETTSMSVMLVLDCSASMNFPDEGVSKFRYGSIVAAALAWLVSTQGDAVGLMATHHGALSFLPARGGRPHLRSLIARINSLRANDSWDPARVISRASELLKRRGLLLVISDFYDAEDETRRELRRVVARGHDAAMLQILSPEETSFPYDGDLEFQDSESGEKLMLDASGARVAYRDEVWAFLQRCRLSAHSDGVDYTLASTAAAPEHVLRAWLLRRSAGHQSAQATTALAAR
jgi:uncharacterized protein (DUF58 family)